MATQRLRRAKIVRPDDEEEVIVSPIADAVEQAQIEVDEETAKVDKIKALIYKLRDTDPEEELTISVRTRVSEWKPWSVLTHLSRKIPVQDFDIENVISDIQNEAGDGNYKLVMYLAGRVIQQYDFYAGDPRKKNTPTPERPQNDNRQDLMTLLPAIMKTSSDSNTQMMTMMMAMMGESRASSDRMMQAQMQMMGLLIPAMTGARQDPTEIMSRFAEIQKSMQPANDGSDKTMQTLDLFIKMKELLGNGSGGKETNAWDIVKEVGPALGAAVAPFLQAQTQSQPKIALPSQPVRTLPPASSPPPLPATASAPLVHDFGDPVLNLIAEDFLFFARRGYSVDSAADTITDRLDDAGITLEQLQAHVAEWNTGGDWFETLAARGVDLRPYKEWATAVFFGVAERIGTEPQTGDTDTAGEGGSEGDT